MKYQRRLVRGFTLVELLVVIVVIAILAAIVVVSYQNITTKAKNTAIISAATEIEKEVMGYIANNGTYPFTGNGTACITAATCIDSGGISRPSSSAITNNLETIGTIPTGLPNVPNGVVNGILLGYNSLRQYNGASAPQFLEYGLIGEGAQCTLPDVANGGGNTAGTSTTGETSYSNGAVLCIVVIPGPPAS